MTTISNRYEFVYLFDVENGNPNGDPDAGNMPRIDPETGQGLVTDVCLKRKVRNYVEIAEGGQTGYQIYIKEKSGLNRTNMTAYENLDIKPISKKLPKNEVEARSLTQFMCKNFFDIRAFGAVMTTDVNCGQVRGPIQINFAKSIDPIIPQEISITRMAVTHEKDLEKERTMGRKYIVPYGLYRAEGYISAHLAMGEKGTGFSADDLEILFTSLINMFDHDHSAARGKMNARKLIVFKHDTALGNAPAHKLFDLVTVRRKTDENTPPRSYDVDYECVINTNACPEGVTIDERL